MTEEQKKILQFEQELEKISSQLDHYREQVSQLKKNAGESRPQKNEITVGEEFINKTGLEFPGERKNTPVSLENFIGLRLLHLAGIVVLVIGISIGVKYAVDKELISPASRIILAYCAGIILFVFSVRLYKKLQLFSAILFSGAMASIYFTTYAAFVYYHLFPIGLAFGVMALITVFTAYNALRYDRQEIAILGMTGAYGIPFLISANSDRIELFFAYIILINSGVLFLSYKKKWKAMVRLTMLVSWVLFIGWALIRYHAEQQNQAIIVMLIFYCLFALESLGFSINKKEKPGNIDLLLFVLNNILGYAASLLIFIESNHDNGASMVTGVACIIFSFQAFLAKVLLPAEKLLFKYLVAFALVSLVFYIGMKWDGVTVMMLWLGVAVGLFSAGAISKMGWLRLLAIILTGVTLGKLILVDRKIFTTEQKIISYISIGVILLLLSFFYQKLKPKSEV